MKKYILLILIVLLFPSVGFSAPAVTTITQGWAEDDSETITGTGFGAGGAPLQWLKANIEAGTPGDDFTSTGWSTTASAGGVKPKYSTTRAHSGSQSIIHNFDSVQYLCEIVFNAGAQKEIWYVSGWVYLDKLDDYTQGQWKVWRISDTSAYAVSADLINDSWFYNNALTVWSGGNALQAYRNAGATNYVVGSTSGAAYPAGQWIRLEMYAKNATSDSGSDGIWWTRRVGKSAELNATNVSTRESGDAPWRYLRIGQYIGNLSGGTGPRDWHIYWDDIYVADTRARVEVCNADAYENATVCEIQIPSAWATDSITVTVNNGSLTANDGTNYLYIIDSNGVVSDQDVGAGGSQGFLIPFPGGDVIAPVLSGGGPSGEQACDANPDTETIVVTTDENATCKYDLSDVAYASMANTFSTTGTTSHSQDLVLNCGSSYTYYVRCVDAIPNESTTTTISFSIAAGAQSGTTMSGSANTSFSGDAVLDFQ